MQRLPPLLQKSIACAWYFQSRLFVHAHQRGGSRDLPLVGIGGVTSEVVKKATLSAIAARKLRITEIMLPLEARVEQPRHTSIVAVPQPMRTMPTARPTQRPGGISFSASTRMVRAAIQTRFMAPPTNKSVIRAQQHPKQYAPWITPSRIAPTARGRQLRDRNSAGERQ